MPEMANMVDNYRVTTWSFLAILALATEARKKRLSDNEILQVMTHFSRAQDVMPYQVRAVVRMVRDGREDGR